METGRKGDALLARFMLYYRQNKMIAAVIARRW
jgi:hypothetical protein